MVQSVCGMEISAMFEKYVVLDFEMTGLRAKTDRILEVGAVCVRFGKPEETLSALIRQSKPLPKKITELTGITDEMASGGRELDEVMEELIDFLDGQILVGQNIIFDYSFLKQWEVNHKYVIERKASDTLKLARKFLPEGEKKDLESLCAYFDIKRNQAHRALDDAIETAQVFECLKERYYAGNEEEFLPKVLQYKAKKQSPATPRQIRFLKEYAQLKQIELPPAAEEMTKSEVSRLTDRLIAQYGKAER